MNLGVLLTEVKLSWRTLAVFVFAPLPEEPNVCRYALASRLVADDSRTEMKNSFPSSVHSSIMRHGIEMQNLLCLYLSSASRQQQQMCRGTWKLWPTVALCFRLTSPGKGVQIYQLLEVRWRRV